MKYSFTKGSISVIISWILYVKCIGLIYEKYVITLSIDQRTVVAGIAEYYKPEDIIGRQVCILVNLEPRKLRGIESQGMILMAENSDGKLCFISPSEDFQNGSEVK